MKLKKQFSEFYTAIRIHRESQNLIDKRKTLQGDVESKFPDEMKKHDIELKKSEIEMFECYHRLLENYVKSKVKAVES